MSTRSAMQVLRWCISEMACLRRGRTLVQLQWSCVNSTTSLVFILLEGTLLQQLGTGRAGSPRLEARKITGIYDSSTPLSE